MCVHNNVSNQNLSGCRKNEIGFPVVCELTLKNRESHTTGNPVGSKNIRAKSSIAQWSSLNYTIFNAS